MATQIGKDAAREVRRHAQANRRDVQRATQRFAMERLIHRVFTGPDADRFLLKGGMLMMIAESAPDQYRARSTTDVDLQAPGYGDGMAAFEAVLNRTLDRVPDPDDGVRFDISALRVETVRERIPGCAVSVPAFVGTVKVRLKCDVTFDARTRSDEMVPADLPSMLPGLAPVRVRRIPFEHVVADKVQSLCRHGPVSYRLRDYYDLYVILSGGSAPDREATADAMARTFAVFGGEVPDDVDDIAALSPAGIASLEAAWRTELGSRAFYVETPPLAEMAALVRAEVAAILPLVPRPGSPAPF
jgi:hypothetical protein